MENILFTLNIIFAVILVVLILLQKSEGGALGLGVSQDSFISSRSAGNFLTKRRGIGTCPAWTELKSYFILANILKRVLEVSDFRRLFSRLVISGTASGDKKTAFGACVVLLIGISAANNITVVVAAPMIARINLSNVIIFNSHGNNS